MTLHKRLREIRDDVERGRFEIAHRSCGICFCLLTSREKAEFEKLVAKWPRYSGDNILPVPGKKGEDIENAYMRAKFYKTMWDRRTAYGKARWELLLWAIEQTKGDR